VEYLAGLQSSAALRAASDLFVIIYNLRQLLLEAAISLAYCYGVWLYGYLVSISRFNIYPKYVLMYIPRYLGGDADTPYAFITLG
jgi:hypothetical protein